MAITSCLSEFSLPELFQFLDQGSKTGLLTLRFLTENQRNEYAMYYYIKVALSL